jgi:hypothetical protein
LKRLPFPFPARGLSEAWGASAQPELTTPDALNVLPLDSGGRVRGASRPGAVIQDIDRLSSSPVQALAQAAGPRAARSSSEIPSWLPSTPATTGAALLTVASPALSGATATHTLSASATRLVVQFTMSRGSTADDAFDLLVEAKDASDNTLMTANLEARDDTGGATTDTMLCSCDGAGGAYNSTHTPASEFTDPMTVQCCFDSVTGIMLIVVDDRVICRGVTPTTATIAKLTVRDNSSTPGEFVTVTNLTAYAATAVAAASITAGTPAVTATATLDTGSTYDITGLTLDPQKDWIVEAVVAGEFDLKLNTDAEEDNQIQLVVSPFGEDIDLDLYTPQSGLNAVTVGNVAVGDVTAAQTWTLRKRGSLIEVWRGTTCILSNLLDLDAMGSPHPTGATITLGDGASLTSIKQYPVTETGAISASARDTMLIASAGGNMYTGTPSAMTRRAYHVLATSGAVSIAVGSAYAYFVDGTNSRRLNLLTFTNGTLAAAQTAGTVPTGCTLAALWRDRLVLAAEATNPQNFYMSRAGTHTDWNYAADDAQAAVAGNATTMGGRIGSPIIALAPMSNSALLLGCDHELHMVQGDPANGGQIVTVSTAIGVLGKDAWCLDPAGNAWLLSTGGLYRVDPAGGIERVSGDQVRGRLAAINRETHRVGMAYDRDRNGIWCFITPTTQGAATHYFYDLALDAWWPQQFPSVDGPTAAMVFDGNSASDRYLLLGGFDGRLRAMNGTTDDGAAIASRLLIGPVRPGGDAENAIASEALLVTGATTNLTAGLVAASRPELLPAVTPGTTVSATAAGRKIWRSRQRGNAFGLKLSATGQWTFEEASAVFETGGRVRA